MEERPWKSLGTKVFAFIGVVATIVAIVAGVLQSFDILTKQSPDLSAVVLYTPVTLPAGRDFPIKAAAYVSIRLTNSGPAAAQDVRLRFNHPYLAIEPAPNAEGDIIVGDLHARRDRQVNIWLASELASWDELTDAVQLTHLNGTGTVRLVVPLPFEYWKGNPGDRTFTAVMFILMSLSLTYTSYQNRQNNREFSEWVREERAKREAHEQTSH